MVAVSVILPIYNAERWLNECLESIFNQTYDQSFELCVHNDCSTDRTLEIVSHWTPKFLQRNVEVILTNSESKIGPLGCGHAKNQAVKSSGGDYLCFVDGDDVMMKERIQKQLDAATALPNDTIIGTKVYRLPENSTIRYTSWINTLTSTQLYTQMYTSHGPTVVMPTWFTHKNVFEKVGGFSEKGKGTPEDYIFFLRHLELGGKLHRVNEVLLMYRHHPNATTISVHEDTIWELRVKEFQRNVLPKWTKFTIWNAGKQGRHFYRDLDAANQDKVIAFCDVDMKKIEKGVYVYEHSQLICKPKVPIISFKDATPPFVICVKMELTNGQFENNLESLNLLEGQDYYHFN